MTGAAPGRLGRCGQRPRARPSRRRSRTSPGSASSPPQAAVVRPTRQTVEKLRRDLIVHLFEKGRLRREHVQAAEEIRRIWQAFSRGLGPAAVNPDSFAGGGRSIRPRQPVEWLTPGEEIIWRRRYRPWAGEMGAVASGGVLRATRFRIVVDLAVDNGSLRQVDAWYRMRNGASFEHLRAGLQRYAEIAGWADPE